MSSLTVEVCRIDKILPHNNANALEIALIKGWQCIVKKGDFQEKDVVIYIPPDALIPKEWSDKWGVTSYLGSNGRVKSIKLRGEPSMGLVIKPPDDGKWKVGSDVASAFGITKYEPPVKRDSQQSNSRPSHPHFIKYTDIENLRNYPNELHDGEDVVVTEKIDGTSVRIGVIHTNNGLNLMVGSRNLTRDEPTKEMIVPFSFKRMLSRIRIEGLSALFKKHRIDTYDCVKAKSNWFWYPYTLDSVQNFVDDSLLTTNNIILYGEVFGPVQDLNYGLKSLNFRAYDISVDGSFLNYDAFNIMCKVYDIPRVPELYRGPYSFDKIKELANGNTIINEVEQIREGCVVRPVKERENRYGRVIFKMIGDEYLIRKSGGKIADYTDQ
jgi:RNA ligase (TIGR02306 family)